MSGFTALPKAWFSETNSNWSSSLWRHTFNLGWSNWILGINGLPLSLNDCSDTDLVPIGPRSLHKYRILKIVQPSKDIHLTIISFPSWKIFGIPQTEKDLKDFEYSLSKLSKPGSKVIFCYTSGSVHFHFRTLPVPCTSG